VYAVTLFLHSWLRWVVLAAGVAAVAAALPSRPTFDASARADRWGLIFTIALDIQVVLGLLLYVFLSPITVAIFDDIGAAMADPSARFWAVEHLSLMIAASAIAHLGRMLAHKATNPSAKRLRLLIGFTLAMIAIAAAIPWPGMSSGRPLFRL
jgi:hypothetical protein